MPFEYSPSRSRGITTSSLILKAFVCLAIAAVRARSAQNFFLASADTATKPSPDLRLAIVTTCDETFPTRSSLSDAISAIRTILGLSVRDAFVE